MSEDETDSLSRIGQEVRETYARNKRVMSFDEFYALFLNKPEQYARTAAQYLKDVFEYFGAEEVKTASHGVMRRWKLFDAPYDDGRDRLVGQEEVQNRVYRV